MISAEYARQALTELYQKMTDENFIGQLSLDDDWLIWKLSDTVILKITIEFHEGYVAVYSVEDKTEKPLTHWHPEIEEIYDDLLKVNTGDVFWVIRKKSFFYPYPSVLSMEKREWESLSDKRKKQYTIIGKEY